MKGKKRHNASSHQNTKSASVFDIRRAKTFPETINHNHRSTEVNSEFAYEWDIVTDSIEWYGEINKTLGYPKIESPRTLHEWMKIIHPDDYEHVKNTIHQHLKTQGLYQEKYRVQRRDGSFLYITDYGTAFRNNELTPYKLVGLMKLSDSTVFCK